MSCWASRPQFVEPILSIRDERERPAGRNMSLRPTPAVERQKSVPCPAIKMLAAEATGVRDARRPDRRAEIAEAASDLTAA